MEWISTHGPDLWMIFSSVVTVASLIAKLTPTTKDDTIVSSLIALLALNKKK
jgi:hypothetical protein